MCRSALAPARATRRCPDPNASPTTGTQPAGPGASQGRVMTIATIFGNSIAQRAMLLLVAAALGGCFDQGNEDQPGDQPPAAQEPPPATQTNHPPEISGTPPASVEAGQPYSFMPQASDEDQDF